MANEIPGLTITRKSTGDMSSYQYRAVAASSTVVAGGVALTATLGGALLGIWLDNSTAASFGAVQVSGVAKVQAGASSEMATAIIEGKYIVSSSVGQGILSTAAGLPCIGIALAPLATDSTGLLPVLLAIGSITPTP